jgi:hypothetical protein
MLVQNLLLCQMLSRIKTFAPGQTVHTSALIRKKNTGILMEAATVLQVPMAKTVLSWEKPLHPLKDFLILSMVMQMVVQKVALEEPKVAQNFPQLGN